MTHNRFFVILFFCALFMGLSVIETWLYRSWEKELAQQREYQMKAVYAEHTDLFTDQLLRRLGREALTDPAFMNLLKRNGITLRPNASPAPPDEAAPLNNSAPMTHATPIPPAPEHP